MTIAERIKRIADKAKVPYNDIKIMSYKYLLKKSET